MVVNWPIINSLRNILFRYTSSFNLRKICVFEYDTVVHYTPFVVFSRGKLLFKINELNFNSWIENPCVYSSILSLATIKINDFTFNLS